MVTQKKSFQTLHQASIPKIEHFLENHKFFNKKNISGHFYVNIDEAFWPNFHSVVGQGFKI